MPEKIKIDVCVAPTEAERNLLVAASTLYWQNKGYSLLNDEIGPDSIKLYEGKIVGAPPNARYMPSTKYAKEPLDEPTVLIFMKE